MMIITFVGHSTLYNHTELFGQVFKSLSEHIASNETVQFYCGGYGEFDQLCARACRAFKETHKNCEIVFVTPYITESKQKDLRVLIESKQYDAILYPPLEAVPLKFAISKRNEWMMSQADLVIAYVAHTHGGAYKTLEYARRKKKQIVNLAE